MFPVFHYINILSINLKLILQFIRYKFFKNNYLCTDQSTVKYERVVLIS